MWHGLVWGVTTLASPASPAWCAAELPPRSAEGRASATVGSLGLRDSTGAARRPPADPGAPVRPAEGLPIRRIDIHPRNIFDPVPPGRWAPAYRLANRLHIRTRSGTIRQQLLFEPGDPWSEARGLETERNLRALQFLTPERIDAQAVGDSATVTVETRDVWTTSPEFNLESADGKQYGSVAFIERNLLGLGKSISFAYREDPSGKTRSTSFDDPNVLGSRARLHFSIADGSSGQSGQLMLGVPFYAEDTPHAYAATWNRNRAVARLYQRAREVATLDDRLEAGEASWGLGTRHGTLIERLGASFLIYQRKLGPTHLLAGAPMEFAGGNEELRLRRFAVEGRLWKPHYIALTDINRMSLIEDFDVGRSLTLKFGYAPEWLGSTADEGFAQGKLDLGTFTPLGFGWVRAAGSTRLRRDLRETSGQLETRWVNRSFKGHTLVLAALGIAGSNMPRDFQVVVGGLNGLRAYPVQALAGQQMWRLNVEDRWKLVESYAQLLTLGVVAFSDAARAWGSGAAGTSWFHSAGMGLRVSFPRWSLTQIVRIDVAWPISPTRDGKRNAELSIGSSQAF